MTFEPLLALIAVGGIVLAVGGRAYGISSWRLFVAACVPAAVAVGLAVWEIGRPCDHREGLEGPRAVPARLRPEPDALCRDRGRRSDRRRALGRGRGGGKGFWHVVGCLFASVRCGGLVLSAALLAALHCYES